jgi:transcriptional regulator with XRE-family HTH domain
MSEHTNTVLPDWSLCNYQIMASIDTGSVAKLWPMSDDPADSEILARAAVNLRVARKVVAPSAVSVARALDLPNPNQWTRYEKGDRKPSLTVLARFCEVYGLSLDFILRNRTDGLPRPMMARLLAQQALDGAPLASEAPASAAEQFGTPAARPDPAGPSDNPLRARTVRKVSA